MSAPAAPTTAHLFHLVSHHDPALDRAACFDCWDSLRMPRLVPDGLTPDVWARFCADGIVPEGTPPSLWRQYLDDGDRSRLVATGPLHVYTCRAISMAELEWAQLQADGDTTGLHAAIVSVALVSVSGPCEVTAPEVDAQRESASYFIRAISRRSRLWHNDVIFPPLTLHSLAGQIAARSRLPEAAATFRQAGGKV